jgi:hypothetical protein
MDNYDIVEVDLQGQILRTVFTLNNLNYQGEGVASPRVEMSPSEEWVVFVIGRGERTNYGIDYARYDKEDIFVISSDGQNGPYKISNGGRAWYYTWSPDSQSLAYSDYDSDGRLQVYLAKYDGSHNKQLTNFETNGTPRLLEWSPNGQYLSMFYEHPEGEYNLLIASKDGELVSIGIFESMWVDIWWDDDSTLAIWIDDEINWFDPNNGSIIQHLLGVINPYMNVKSFGTPNKQACLGFCFGIDKEDYGLFIYDISENYMYQIPIINRVYDMANWHPSPEGFPGEEKCKEP